MRFRRPAAGTIRSILLLVAVSAMSSPIARGQIPGLPGAAAKADPAPKADGAPTLAPTSDNPEATVAASTGPIAVDESAPPDFKVQEKLAGLLPQYPGVLNVEVNVDEGVVTLDGRVHDDDVRQNVTQVARRVKGVSFVVNRMKTDAQVMTARDLVTGILNRYWEIIRREWLAVLLAITLVVLAILSARLFARYSETILAPLVPNVLLRSVMGSILSSLIVLGGVLLGLQVLELTQAVLSILGLAGVVGLAVGFAFRDIAENFIASVLLGVRRPFRIGDYITVAGHAGVVRTLNTRATVLVTLEGKHVRIPNATVFKEITINASASPSTRSDFDVLIPYEVSAASAINAVTEAMKTQEGILPQPPARVLVEAMESTGVRLRATYWQPSLGVDGFRIKSDVLLKAKVALQKAGITPPPTGMSLSVVGRVPVELSRGDRDGRAVEVAARAGTALTAEQVRDNLSHDTHAAANAPAPTNGHATPMEQVLHQDEEAVSEEGENLLADDPKL